MNSRHFVGKKVSLEKLGDCDACVYGPEDYDDEYTVAEIFLHNFELFGPTDKAGLNAYSIAIYLDQDKIVKLQRVVTVICVGGQGSNDDLSRYSHKDLEVEAEDVIESLLSVNN